ncbi:MAG: Smr/MutS family protein [Alphaproteobacteria bacterium]|jgi:DNA-nicking Smr family endonuclease|nr:Smr/MutS family protein [Alphaproteobacteria bacterium]MDP6517694.1 Smr/MutS family protein [Alphaproteobacteria bacterium]
MARRRDDPGKGGAGPGLTREDLELWRAVTRHDRPLPGREEAPSPEPPSEPSPSRPPAPAGPAPRVALPALSQNRPAGLDKRTALRLKRGQIAVDDVLDLHGMTQDMAHGALGRRLAAAQASGQRCVLVITGKGTRPDGATGVLRTMVPRWLDEAPNRARVLAIHAAQPRDGGSGALYVLLRKRR